MERVTVRIPKEQYDDLKELVEDGTYPSKSEAVREAIRELLDEKDVDVETTGVNSRKGEPRRKWNE